MSALVGLLAWQDPAVAASSRCPAIAPIPFSMKLTARYRDDDPTRTRIDPGKNVTQGPLRTNVVLPADLVVKMADAYQAERDPKKKNAIKSCVTSAFGIFAENRSLEGAHSSVDNFYRSWIIARLAIAHMKVFGDNRDAADPAVSAWFARNTNGIIAFQDWRISKKRVQNHLYWGGFAVASVGRMLSVERYHAFADRVLGIGLSGIDNRGLLSAELARGYKARHYHLFAAKPLIGLALINDRRLTDSELARLKLLSSTVVDSFAASDGGLIARVAKAKQAPENKLGSAWLLEPFLDANHQKKLHTFTKGLPRTDPFLGGNIAFLLNKYGSVAPIDPTQGRGQI